VYRAIARRENLAQSIVHTGQHYDINMSEIFFDDLGLPAPNIHLGVGSGSHAEQTAKSMVGLEHALVAERPSLVSVVGDTNGAVSAALVAAKMGIVVAHVEAGLRSFDRRMPEEINRVVVDHIADLLFTPSPDANDNLAR
jgi:UDP-N-acetylglucosamine 2-epimerase (non-hydrolysing)